MIICVLRAYTDKVLTVYQYIVLCFINRRVFCFMLKYTLRLYVQSSSKRFFAVFRKTQMQLAIEVLRKIVVSQWCSPGVCVQDGSGGVPTRI